MKVSETIKPFEFDELAAFYLFNIAYQPVLLKISLEHWKAGRQDKARAAWEASNHLANQNLWHFTPRAKYLGNKSLSKRQARVEELRRRYQSQTEYSLNEV